MIVGSPVTAQPPFLPIFGAYLLAYCLFDLVLVLWYIGIELYLTFIVNVEDYLGDILIIVHHIMIAAWVANSGLAHANFGVGVFFMTNEISTVFLNFRYSS